MRPDSHGFSGDAAKSENSNNSDSVKRVMRSQGKPFVSWAESRSWKVASVVMSNSQIRSPDEPFVHYRTRGIALVHVGYFMNPTTSVNKT